MKTNPTLARVAFLAATWITVSSLAQTPPPSAPAQRSAADLEKLVAPIALYPDPLIATILPASVYPLEIVQAARFVKDTNNLAKLDQQSWDDNVKAVARVPEVIAKMNEDLDWTTSLGQAFLDQQKDVMDMIQTLRAKAQQAGTLKTTPQQVVVVTNTVVEKTLEQTVVVVTNTIVQIQPADPQVVYVPTYNPYAVYYPPPGPPPIITFAAGVAVGAIIANNCDWHGGGIYIGPHGMAAWGGGWGHNDVDIDINRNVNINQNNINIQNRPGQGQKWQPDQNRLRTSGAPGATQSLESRGWSSSAAHSSVASGLGGTPGTAGALSRNQTAPSVGASRPAPSPDGGRPSPGASRPAASTPGNIQRGSGAPPGSRDSAFGGMNNGARDHAFSQRGSASRGGSRGRR